MAANYQHFAFWCQKVEIGVHDPRVRYVRSVVDLHGVSDLSLTLYGPYWRNPDWPRIEAERWTYCESSASCASRCTRTNHVGRLSSAERF